MVPNKYIYVYTEAEANKLKDHYQRSRIHVFYPELRWMPSDLVSTEMCFLLNLSTIWRDQKLLLILSWNWGKRIWNKNQQQYCLNVLVTLKIVWDYLPGNKLCLTILGQKQSPGLLLWTCLAIGFLLFYDVIENILIWISSIKLWKLSWISTFVFKA